MKKIGIILMLTSLLVQGFSQELSADSTAIERQNQAVNEDEKTKISIGDNLLSVEKSDSAVNLRVGDKELEILESLQGKKFDVKNHNNDKNRDQNTDREIDRDRNQDWFGEWGWNQDNDNHRSGKRRSSFKGHWAGVELGLNNYLTSDNSNVLPNEIDYMTLRSSKSMSFNINFSQLNLRMGRHIGFVTGFGLNWNNYKFSGNNNIQEGANGIIEILDPGSPLEKSKLTTLYLDMPFLLEIQFPLDNHHLNIAAGPIGGVKIGSHTKMVFEEGPKIKSNKDFSLNLLRYGATARVGYENLQIYGTYYVTPLFKEGKGPSGYDLYPFEIGLAFTFND
jgi:hypothetical protein